MIANGNIDMHQTSRTAHTRGWSDNSWSLVVTVGSKYKVWSPNYPIIKFLVENYTGLQISIFKMAILDQWLRGVALWSGLEFESQLGPLLLMICEPDNQLSWSLGLRRCRQSNPYKNKNKKPVLPFWRNKGPLWSHQ
jgi:hypothetical protein